MRGLGPLWGLRFVSCDSLRLGYATYFMSSFMPRTWPRSSPKIADLGLKPRTR